MESDMAAYKSDFLQETYECLDVFNQSFVDLENGENAAIDEIFRIAHTIKGMAGFLEYTSLETLCHNMEEVLGGIKNGEIEINGELVDIMLLTVDRITDIVKQIEAEDNDNIKIVDLLETFDIYKKMRTSEKESHCIQEQVESNTLHPEINLEVKFVKSSENSDSLNSEYHKEDETKNIYNTEDYNLILDVTLSKDCIMKNLRALIILESLKDLCEVTKEDPDENERDENFNGHFTAFISGDYDKVEELMDRIPEIESFNIVSNDENKHSNSTSEESQKNTAPIPNVVHEAIDNSSTNNSNIFNSSINNLKSANYSKSPDCNEILTGKEHREFSNNNQSQKIQEMEPAEPDLNNHCSESSKPKKAHSETKKQEIIRVSTTNLDNIMNLVGELVINKGRLLQISQEYKIAELEEATGTLDKSISSLQDQVMRTRMVKIERIFSKFPRMVRDLSRKLNKHIDFEIEGQDTELDRTILDEISDPLVHLVRNAVDHGIEYPEERKTAGKSEIGHIKLSARREKNNVIIEIEDDGKGLDVELLKKKALEKGLLLPSDIEDLSEDEIRMLIFIPGFSTKESATEISGRGVGMDAVKTAVEKLGGKVRVYSKKGESAKFRIDLPPTVAIIKSLLVKVGSETYAIPISNVVKALSVSHKDYKLVKETPLLYIKDKLIPVLWLKDIFNVKCEKLDTEIAIITEQENEEVGLIVDSILDQQEIVIKSLGNVFSNIKGFIGVTILGDGRVIPILDISTIVRGGIDD